MESLSNASIAHLGAKLVVELNVSSVSDNERAQIGVILFRGMVRVRALEKVVKRNPTLEVAAKLSKRSERHASASVSIAERLG